MLYANEVGLIGKRRAGNNAASVGAKVSTQDTNDEFGD